MVMVRKCALWLLLIVLLLTGCQRERGVLGVENPWARPAAAGDNSAVYFEIRNLTAESDMLLSAESDAARAVELHISQMDSEGVMRMERQESVVIPSQEMVVFQPGGLHVMLINLNQALQPGDTIPLVLNFERAGEIELVATVQEAPAEH
jgi:periplasmic copper chaperone A